MASFGKESLARLNTCDYRLQRLFNEVIKYFDCTVVYGHRTESDQNKAFKEGKSKVKFPKSKHNTYPSKAADVVPYIDGVVSWDKDQCYFFSGFVKGVAAMMGIKIITGADWNNNNNIKDQTFNDIIHFELYD